MSCKELPFHSFIQLVALDEKVRVLKQQITVLKNVVSQHVLEKKRYDEELEKAHKLVLSAKKEVDMLELVMKELDALESTKKGQLEQVTGFKDYQSLQQELSHVQAKQQAQEQAVLKAWSVYESAQEAYNLVQKKHQEKSQEINQMISQKNTSMDELEKMIISLEQERPSFEHKVSPEWLELYAHMSGQVADPVVPVVEGSCGSCFHVLTKQEILQAERGNLVQCKGCFRLLYLERSMQPERI